MKKLTFNGSQMTKRWLFGLIFLFPLAALQAQNVKEVRGIVSEQIDHQPLAGVSVTVKGTKNITLTDDAGRFKIVAKPGDILLFTHVEFSPKEIKVGVANNLTVFLSKSASELEDVVVTALGIKKSTRALTYSTQQLNGDDLTKVRDNSGNVLNSLAGKIAGASVTSAATGPGSAVRIVLRGNKSINGNNNALIVVDGVPYDNSAPGQAASTFSSYGGSDGAANINPDDIESVNILKGPSAAALYGSRAANGAIIITTKKGKEGKAKIDYNGSVLLDQPVLLMRFQNKYGRGNAGVSSLNVGQSWGGKVQTYPDNVLSFFNTALSVNNAISISGGNDKIQGFTSYANNQDNGIISNNNLNRNTLNVRVSTHLMPKLTTDAKITFVSQNIRNKPRQGETGTSMEAYIMPRDMSQEELKDYEDTNLTTGEPLRKYWINSSIYDNPYWSMYRTSVNEKRNRVTLLGLVKYQLTNWLSIQGRFSLDRYNDQENGSFYDGTVSLESTKPGGRYYERYGELSEQNIDLLLSGDNKLSQQFTLNYNFGASILDRKRNNVQNNANGLSIPNQFNLAFATTPAFSGLVINRRELQSIYGNAQLRFKNYLYLDLTGRNDWSSTLPPPYSYFYPSVGVSMVLSDALKLPEWTSFAKLRVSYTHVGNDAEPYLLAQLYDFSLGAQQGFVSRSVTRAISNLKPEKTKSSEIGLDWKFLNNRIGIDATVYQSNTINQLLFIGLPVASGYTQQYINAGNVENKGIELMLTVNPIRESNFSWNSAVNFSRNVNKVLELNPKKVNIAAGRLADVIVQEGGAYGDLYGYAWKKNEKGEHIVNANGLPIVENNKKLGNFNPDFLLGWNNNFNYRRFHLSFLIDGRVGGEVVSGTDSFLGDYGIGKYTEQYREGGLILPAVFEDGTANNKAITAEQLWTTVSQNGRDAWGEFITYSATNFRLRELSLGYDFNIKDSWVKNANVSLTGRNLFFFYLGKATLDLPGIDRTIPVDPEAALGIGNYQGVEAGLLPSVRSFGLNIKLSF